MAGTAPTSQVYKEYNRHFLLEPTKLTRIVDTVHDCIAAVPGVTAHDNFELFLKGARHEELSSVDAVVAADNSKKHKIQRLAFHCSAAVAGASRTEYEVQIDFGGLSNSQQAPATKTKVISIAVKSDNASWNSRTLSQVEEQVERTWMHQTISLGLLIGLLAICLFFVASQFLTFFPSTSATWWLARADRERLVQMLRDHPTLTDEDLREIETRQLKNVLRDNGIFPESEPSPKNNAAAPYLLVSCIVVVIICIIVLFTCYPSAVFLWGDEKGRYDAVLQRRKVVWSILSSGLLAGVISKVWYEILSKAPH
jgi:hypothetical protein